MLADDLIGAGLATLVEDGWFRPACVGRSTIGSGVTADRDACEDSGVVAPGTAIPKLGVLVEIGVFVVPVLSGNFSSLLNGDDELKFVDGVLARGGSAILVDESLGSPEGISIGAGCKVEFAELGKAIGGTTESEGGRVAAGKGLDPVLAANPLDGVLLNISKAFDALLGMPVATWLGPETSGNVSSCPNSSSTLSGVSVPFIATKPPYSTKSNNTTTTAVLIVCTAVLPDRMSNLKYSLG